MANNFMLKLLILFFGYLNFGAFAQQISKKPDVAASAIQNGGYQASTLLTSVINKADIAPHDIDASNAQAQSPANATDPADMDNDEVLSDAEEEEEDDDVESPANGNTAMNSGSKGGKRLKAHLVRFHKADCEKKRHPKKGKKMKEGKCHTLHKNHFQSYEFCIVEQKKDKKHKKGKDDDDDDESGEDPPKGCRMMIFFDGKCKDEASSTNAEESCKDIGEEGIDDDNDDDKDDKKLHARDLLTKRGKGPKYKSAKFLCDGVETSNNTTKTVTEEDYYVTTTVSSQPIRIVTASSSKSYAVTRSTKLASHSSCSGEPTATGAPIDEKEPDSEDDEKEDDDDDKEDEKDDDDDEKEVNSTASQTNSTKKLKTKSHRSKTHTKSKKHHSKTKTVSATQSAQATSDSLSP